MWIKQEKALGQIKEGPSQFVSPIFFIGKKDSGEKRVIIDYRRVNTWTVQDHNPMPGIREAMDKLQGKTLFSKFNVLLIYHPQTDGQSEKTNQHLKMALRIYCNYQQNDWVKWLPIVQYAINARPSATMKQAPYKLWMGFIPRAHQADRASNIPVIELHKEQLKEARRQALEAMK